MSRELKLGLLNLIGLVATFAVIYLVPTKLPPTIRAICLLTLAAGLVFGYALALLIETKG